MKYLFIFGFIFAALIITEWIRRVSLQRLLRDIYEAAYVKKDNELFKININSPQAKMLMSDVSRLLIKLNYYITNDCEDMVIKVVNRLKNINLSKRNAKAFYSTAIGYYAYKQRNDTIDLLDELRKKYEHTHDKEMILLIIDCQLIYDIYIGKDTNKIEFLKEIIQSDVNNRLKVIYYIRLSYLYNVKGNKEASEQQLELALKIADQNFQKKIKHILQEGWS